MHAHEGHRTHDGVQERTVDAHGQRAPRHCAQRWRGVVRRGRRPRLHAVARGEGHLTIRLLWREARPSSSPQMAAQGRTTRWPLQEPD
jgi:hypothetical protein